MTWWLMWSRDVMCDMVGTKRWGRDGGPSTMLWQVELTSVGEMQVKEESETGRSTMHLAAGA